MTSTRPSLPWTVSDVRTAFLTMVGGVALAFIAWWGSSGTGRLDRQVTWTIVAVIAIIVIGLGSFSWLIGARRAVALKRGDVMDMLERAAHSLAGDRAPTSIDRTFLVLAGSERYHRDGCLLLRGKDVQRVPNGARSLNGRRPCEMCEP